MGFGGLLVCYSLYRILPKSVEKPFVEICWGFGCFFKLFAAPLTIIIVVVLPMCYKLQISVLILEYATESSHLPDEFLDIQGQSFVLFCFYQKRNFENDIVSQKIAPESKLLS